MERMYLEMKEFEGKKFYYVDIGSGRHGRVNFRLWVNANLVKFNEDGKAYIELPLTNARIFKTEKGNFVLRPADGWYVYNVGVSCGYRGTSSFTIVEPEKDVEIFEYVVYHSPVGSLGISHYGLVNSTSDRLKVAWERDGRLYGAKARGITIYHADGTQETIDGIADGIEALKELEGDAQ
jgi:hypothetical protein